MADLTRVRRWADALIALHLDRSVWTFGFDNAKTRAGQCDYAAHRITVSRYLAARYDDDDVHQILLHEIAHALAGSRSGHGPRWRQIASELGYEGSRLHSGEIASELASWTGTCPRGHVHYRYRRPARALSCGLCSKRFSAANLIDWTARDIDAGTRRLVSSTAREG